ncbi:hypothetical protein CDAR_472521, partial [Caerostris darwini]
LRPSVLQLQKTTHPITEHYRDGLLGGVRYGKWSLGCRPIPPDQNLKPSHEETEAIPPGKERPQDQSEQNKLRPSVLQLQKTTHPITEHYRDGLLGGVRYGKWSLGCRPIPPDQNLKPSHEETEAIPPGKERPQDQSEQNKLRSSVLQLQETTQPITQPLQGWTFTGIKESHDEGSTLTMGYFNSFKLWDKIKESHNEGHTLIMGYFTLLRHMERLKYPMMTVVLLSNTLILLRLRPSVLQLLETTHPITDPLQRWTPRGYKIREVVLGYRPMLPDKNLKPSHEKTEAFPPEKERSQDQWEQNKLRPNVLQLQETTHPITEPLQGWTFRGYKIRKVATWVYAHTKRILNDSQEDSATEETDKVLE